MEVKLTIESQQLNKHHLRQLIQGIRTCEQIWFPDKEISIWIEAPELSTSECEAILLSIKPPYRDGPKIFKRRQQ